MIALVNFIDKVSPYSSPKEKILSTVGYLVILNIYFGSSSLFCMFRSVNSIPDFCYQLIPHALIGKITWILYIPHIKSFQNSIYTFFCNSKSQVIVTQNVSSIQENSTESSKSTKNNPPIEESVNSKDQLRTTISQVLNNDSLTASIVELAEMLNVKLAILMSIPFVLDNFIIVDPESSESIIINSIDKGKYINWFICVLITFVVDQIIGVGGFWGFFINGIIVDANLSLGNENIFNPIGKFRYGDQRQAVKDTLFVCFAILSVLTGISSAG